MRGGDSIPNYRLNMVNPHCMEKDDFAKLQTDLRQVFELLHSANDKDAMDEIITTDPHYENMDPETVSTIGALLNMKLKLKQNDKEATNMCRAWEENLADARQEGIKLGIEQGKKQWIERGSEMERTFIVRKLMSSMKMTIEEAMDFVEIPDSCRERIREKIAY